MKVGVEYADRCANKKVETHRFRPKENCLYSNCGYN